MIRIEKHIFVFCKKFQKTLLRPKLALLRSHKTTKNKSATKSDKCKTTNWMFTAIPISTLFSFDKKNSFQFLKIFFVVVFDQNKWFVHQIQDNVS